MTDHERKVKERWPEAYAIEFQRFNKPRCHIRTRVPRFQILGEATTRDQAWADAAARLEQSA